MAIVKIYNKARGVTYVYESHSYWDKELKQPRSNRKLIGKVDPETGEVSQKDILIDCLFSHCAKQNGFVPENGPLTDSVFRVLLSRNNQPMSSAELGEIINKNANTILKTLTSRPYRGIRPV